MVVDEELPHLGCVLNLHISFGVGAGNITVMVFSLSLESYASIDRICRVIIGRNIGITLALPVRVW